MNKTIYPLNQEVKKTSRQNGPTLPKTLFTKPLEIIALTVVGRFKLEIIALTLVFGCLRFVIGVFPDHTHLLFLTCL